MADLKPPLKGYALWFLAHEHYQQTFQDVIDNVARQHNIRRFVAHATLLGLTEKTENDLPSIQASAKSLAVTWRRPLSMEVIGVGERHMYFQSVFLPVVPTDDLLLLSKRARMSFGRQNDPPYMPHWSGAYGDLSPDVKRAIRNLFHDAFTFPLEVRISSIAVVDVSGFPNEWHILSRYPLES